MPTKQWLHVEVGNEIVMYLLLSLIPSLDFKPLFVSIEANSGSVFTDNWDKTFVSSYGAKILKQASVGNCGALQPLLQPRYVQYSL